MTKHYIIAVLKDNGKMHYLIAVADDVLRIEPLDFLSKICKFNTEKEAEDVIIKHKIFNSIILPFYE